MICSLGNPIHLLGIRSHRRAEAAPVGTESGHTYESVLANSTGARCGVGR
jgi:hypothetical protein